MSTPLIALNNTGPLRPIRTHITRLPDVLDFIDVALDQKRLEIILKGRLDGQGTLRKCRAAPADEACLGRFDLRDNQPDMIRRREDRFDVPDLHRRRASQSLSVNRIGF